MASAAAVCVDYVPSSLASYIFTAHCDFISVGGKKEGAEAEQKRKINYSVSISLLPPPTTSTFVIEINFMTC